MPAAITRCHSSRLFLTRNFADPYMVIRSRFGNRSLAASPMATSFAVDSTAVLPSARKMLRTPCGPYIRSAMSRSSTTSGSGRTRKARPRYIPQKAQRLCGQASVAWMIKEPASLGGRYTTPSYRTLASTDPNRVTTESLYTLAGWSPMLAPAIRRRASVEVRRIAPRRAEAFDEHEAFSLDQRAEAGKAGEVGIRK